MATARSNIESNVAPKPATCGNGEASKRLQRELMQLMMSQDKSVSAFPEGGNIFKWAATINGPVGTVYAGLRFKLLLEFNPRYPYVAPNVHFVTRCFHPNVDSEGNICLDILKDKWTALLDVRTVLLSIQSLLGEPNLDSPLDPNASMLWSKASEFKKALMQRYNFGNENHSALAKESN